MTHQELVAIANEIFCELEGQHNMSDLDPNDEGQSQKMDEIAERVRDVVGIEKSGGADYSLLTLADVFLRAIARRREWKATHDAAGRPLPAPAA